MVLSLHKAPYQSLALSLVFFLEIVLRLDVSDCGIGTVHIDVSIVHSASKAVKEASRKNTQGYYNLLRQRERTKIRTAQSWLSIPKLSEVRRSHEQFPMEEDPDTRAEPSTFS